MNQCKRISVNALVQLLKNPENGDQCKKISAKNSPPSPIMTFISTKQKACAMRNFTIALGAGKIRRGNNWMC